MGWLDRREARQPLADDARSPGDVDYARVIHSASFRRLQGKTQILNLGDSDFYRTRLTHSLEVSQIAGGLVAQLARKFPDHPATAILPDRSMIQAIACAHDLGHPPFGHGGEVALNYCMRDDGGFEGNGQTLRLLSRLEAFSAHAGANLTRRSLLGVLKYPVAYSRARGPQRPALHQGLSALRIIDTQASTPPKCYLDCEAGVVDWILADLTPDDRDLFTSMQSTAGHGKSLHKSLDCSIMDLADDIAYGIHDLEDAIALDLVQPHEVREAVSEGDCALFLDEMRRNYPQQDNGYDADFLRPLHGDEAGRKQVIGRLVRHLIGAIELHQTPGFVEPLLGWRAALPEGPQRLLTALKAFVMVRVIRSPVVQQLEFKGQGMVVAVFEAMTSDPQRLLPQGWRQRFDTDGTRAICDHVASLTDASLLKTYERLFSPRMGSVFDRL